MLKVNYCRMIHLKYINFYFYDENNFVYSYLLWNVCTIYLSKNDKYLPSNELFCYNYFFFQNNSHVSTT